MGWLVPLRRQAENDARSSAVVAGGSVTTLVKADPQRRAIIVFNSDLNVRVNIGIRNSITTTQGIPLVAAAGLVFNAKDYGCLTELEWFCISTGVPVNLEVVEVVALPYAKELSQDVRQDWIAAISRYSRSLRGRPSRPTLQTEPTTAVLGH